MGEAAKGLPAPFGATLGLVTLAPSLPLAAPGPGLYCWFKLQLVCGLVSIAVELNCQTWTSAGAVTWPIAALNPFFSEKIKKCSKVLEGNCFQVLADGYLNHPYKIETKSKLVWTWNWTWVSVSVAGPQLLQFSNFSFLRFDVTVPKLEFNLLWSVRMHCWWWHCKTM